MAHPSLQPRIAIHAALVAATLVVAGCATTQEEAAPLPKSAETPVATPTPATPARQSSPFDESGNPYAPGTTRLLDRTFYFEYDRSVLKPESLAELEKHAEALRGHPERVVVIEGHADERGTREYNIALGERRAETVRKFLVAAGVASRQLETVSYGEERPAKAGSGETAWSQNRRAFMDYTNGSSQGGERTVSSR